MLPLGPFQPGLGCASAGQVCGTGRVPRPGEASEKAGGTRPVSGLESPKPPACGRWDRAHRAAGVGCQQLSLLGSQLSLVTRSLRKGSGAAHLPLTQLQVCNSWILWRFVKPCVSIKASV